MLFLKYLWEDIKRFYRRLISRSVISLKPGKNQYLRYKLQEKWERLGLRKWANNNPKIILGTSITTVSIFIVILIAQCVPSQRPNIPRIHKVWFYDINTNKLFIADNDEVAPIDAPSGKMAGVRAYVLSYSFEPNESERFIAYLEKFTPEGKKCVLICRKAGTKVTKEMILELNKNRFVCNPNDMNWFLADSNDGRLILQQAYHTNEKGQIPISCLPVQK